MELTEISDRLDLRLNSFEVPIEVDEYEKSLYMTRAQKVIYKELCDQFEVTDLVSTYLHPFIVEFVTVPTIVEVTKVNLLPNTINIVVPTNIYRVIWEKAVLESSNPAYHNKEVKVLKTRISEIQYKQDNPFRKPNNKEVLRIVTATAGANDLYELMLPEGCTLGQYSCKYLKDIEPILLEDFTSSGLEIENISVATNSLFSDEIVEKIIDLAVASILQDKTVFNQQQSV